MQRLKLPDIDKAQPLNKILFLRTSIREFQSNPLSEQQISHLLWACQGMNMYNRRTSPSAGALYPLEIYLIDDQQVTHYIPQGHRIEIHSTGDIREDLSQAALGQEFIAQAPATILIAAVYQRVAVKYGELRSTRYVDLEAGHAAQNLLLQATAEGLGSVPVGAFQDNEVADLIGLPADHAPLYLVSVGHAVHN